MIMPSTVRHAASSEHVRVTGGNTRRINTAPTDAPLVGIVREVDGYAGEFWANVKTRRKPTFLTVITNPDVSSLAFLSTAPASQQEQDDVDERAHKRAMEKLASSWQERLQLISVITTFFASMEAAVLVVTDPSMGDKDPNDAPLALKAANAGILGALVMHVYSAVLSFLAAFLLTRWKLREASKFEHMIELVTHDGRVAASPTALQRFENSPEKQNGYSDTTEERPSPEPAPGYETQSEPANVGAQRGHMPQHLPAQPACSGSEPMEPPIFSRNPHLEQVGPFWLGGRPSQHLLSRMHSLCVLLASLGFALAIMGILCYSFVRQPFEVRIFAATILAAGILAVLVLLAPDVTIRKVEDKMEDKIEEKEVTQWTVEDKMEDRIEEKEVTQWKVEDKMEDRIEGKEVTQ